MNAAFPFNNRDHGAPSLHLLQILSINIHPNAEAVWDKEIAPLLTVLEGMKICAHTVIILCIYLYYTIYVLCCSYTNWHFCPSGVLMLGFCFFCFFSCKDDRHLECHPHAQYFSLCCCQSFLTVVFGFNRVRCRESG